MIAEIETVSPADALIAAEPRLAEFYSRDELSERLNTLSAQLLSAGLVERQMRRGEVAER